MTFLSMNLNQMHYKFKGELFNHKLNPFNVTINPHTFYFVLRYTVLFKKIEIQMSLSHAISTFTKI